MLNLIGVIIAFITIIFLIRKRVNFGLAIIFGSFIIGIFSLQEISFIDIPMTFIEAIIYSFKQNEIILEPIELALLMTLIYILAKAMQDTGAINRLIDSLRFLFNKGGTIGVIPAIYGLMPVPGGALFSAPSIDKEGDKFKLDNNQKNFLNVWFRHIWFPIFPLSAAMILICSSSFSNININSLIIVNIPAFISFILIGTFYIKYFTGKIDIKKENNKLDLFGMIYILPPVIPIILYWILQNIGINIPNIRAFLIGIFFSFILLFIISRFDKTSSWNSKVIFRSITWKLALAIFGILIFREMFEVSQASVIITGIISNLPFPSLIMVIVIPLLLGILTGYNLGAIALSYSIVEPFFPSTISIVGITSIIYISSLVGYLISPIHLCNVVSSDYLKTDTTRMYKIYIPSAILLLTIQTIFVVLFFRP